MTTKERSNLRALASKIDAVTQVGKLGVNDALIEGLDKALSKRELIKITVLENSSLTAKDVGVILADKLNAEFVSVIGKKVVLYRYSDKDGVRHIEF